MKLLYSYIILSLLSISALAQDIIKPTIMIIPDADWCIAKGDTTSDGLVDYEAAVIDDYFSSVNVGLEGLMVRDYGYECENLSATLDEIKNIEALSMLKSSQLDILAMTANADIFVSIAIDKKKRGPKVWFELNFKALDSSTLRVMHAESVVSPSRTSATGLIEHLVHSGVLEHFCNSLQRLFDAQIQNGRECRFDFSIDNSCDFDFNTTIADNGDSYTLAKIIEQWFSEKTVSTGSKGNPNSTLSFEGTRIPLLQNGKKIDAQRFVRGMRSTLNKYGINMNISPLGIGKAHIVLTKL